MEGVRELGKHRGGRWQEPAGRPLATGRFRCWESWAAGKSFKQGMETIGFG